MIWYARVARMDVEDLHWRFGLARCDQGEFSVPPGAIFVASLWKKEQECEGLLFC